MKTFFVVLVLALTGCGDKATSKSSNNGSSNNGGTNNGTTVVNNGTIPGGGSCPGGICPGDCFDDGWCGMHAALGHWIALWAESADDIWLAEQNGLVLRGSGSNWEELPVPTTNQLNDIIGDGSGNIWVSAYPEGVYRFDGADWVLEEMEGSPEGANRFAHDTVTNTVFVEAGENGLFERVGSEWVRIASMDHDWGGLTDATNCGGQRYFAIGHPSIVEDGKVTVLGIRENVRATSSGKFPDGRPLFGGDAVVTWNDRFESISHPSVSRSDSVAGTSMSDIWTFVAGEELWHFDGAEWTLIRTIPFQGGTSSPKAVFADTPGEVMLIDKNGRTHFLDANGDELEVVPPPIPAQTLGNHPSFHVSSDEFWVATPSLLHWTRADGWNQVGSMPSDLVEFVARNEADAWGVDEAGVLHHWDGDRRRDVDTGLTVPLTDVALSGTGILWAAGPSGVASFDGTAWTVHDGFDAGGVHTDATDVELVADGSEAWILRNDEAFHFDGTNWETTLGQPGVVRVGCDGDTLIGLAQQNPALLAGRVDQLRPSSDVISEEGYSAFGSWMTGPDDVWVTAQAEPSMQHLVGETWSPSIQSITVGARDVQQVASGHVFALTRNAVLVREP